MPGILHTTNLDRLRNPRVAAQNLNSDVASAAGLKRKLLVSEKSQTASRKMDLKTLQTRILVVAQELDHIPFNS